jgi:ribulose-phosphate 3-epimerase
MRISASVSSLPFRDLPGVARKMEKAGVDAWHLDSIESREAFELADFLRKISNRPRDLHLITSDPVKYWNEIRRTGIEATSIQIEQLHSPLFIPKDLLGRVGIALLANTQPEAFAPYEKQAGWLLIMTTTPGYSGGTFQSSHFEKIVRFRLAYPHTPIFVDGGVVPEIAAVLKMIGVVQVVSGSYLLSGAGVAERVQSLKNAGLEEGRVKEIMVRRSHWPSDFQRFLLEIEKDESEGFQWFINKRGELSRINKVLSGSLPLMVHEDLALPLLERAIGKFEGETSSIAVVNDLFQLSGLLALSNNTTH